MLSTKSLLALGLSLLFHATTTAAQSLLVNGGFENALNPLANWEAAGGASIFPTTTDNPFEGRNSIVANDNANHGMRQIFQIATPGTYTLSFYIRATSIESIYVYIRDGRGFPVNLYQAYNDLDDGEGTSDGQPLPGNTYEMKTLSGSLAAGTYDVYIYGSGQNLQLDGFRVNAGPIATGAITRRNLERRFEQKRLDLERFPHCTSGQLACPISATGAGYECLEENELTSCGGCVIGGHGQDCTTLLHAENVGCDAGRCLVFSCKPGFAVKDGICQA